MVPYLCELLAASLRNRPKCEKMKVVSSSRVALELGDTFDGKGVLIDHYIIQLDNGTQLETPDSTHSFDIMYNTINISAHNCAGYSDPFPLDIEYREGLLLDL